MSAIIFKTLSYKGFLTFSFTIQDFTFLSNMASNTVQKFENLSFNLFDNCFGSTHIGPALEITEVVLKLCILINKNEIQLNLCNIFYFDI